MRRKPDTEEVNSKPGEIPCTFLVWTEPDDLTWEDIHDPTVDEKEPPGLEIYCIIVEAHYDVEFEGQTFHFSGANSLGGVSIDERTTFQENQKYLKEEIEEVKAGAYEALVVDIRAAADGDNVAQAQLEQKAAATLPIPSL